MNRQNWKIVAASVAGTSHVAADAPCQDSYFHKIVAEEILIVAVADGAGSARSGLAGAQNCCAFFVEAISDWLNAGGKMEDLNREAAATLVKNLQIQLLQNAEAGNQNLADFACTFLGAIIGARRAAFLQIGDGAIVYADGDEYKLFTAPQQGEYANSTNFVTDDGVLDVLKYELIEKEIGELAMFTDGLQRLAIDFQTARPHEPFFRSMLAPLRGESRIENLEKKLSEFLDSPKINERTDDDKTLILASRLCSRKEKVKS